MAIHERETFVDGGEGKGDRVKKRTSRGRRINCIGALLLDERSRWVSLKDAFSHCGPMHETIGSIRRWLASIPLPPFDQSPSRSLFDRKTHHGDHDWMSGRVNDGGRFWKSVVQQSDKSVESKDWLEWVRREFDFLVEEFVTRTKNFWRRKEGLLYIPSYKEI